MSITEKKNQIINLTYHGDLVQVYVDRENMKIIDDVQLDELSKEDSLFFPLESFEYEEQGLRLDYKAPQTFKMLKKIAFTGKEQFQKIVQQILTVEKLAGTPYTPLVTKENIFVDDVNTVKFAFRGLRMVTTNIEITRSDIFNDCKTIICELFKVHFNNEHILHQLHQCTHAEELLHIINNFSDSNQTNEHNQDFQPLKEKSEKQLKNKTSKLVLLVGIIGILIGIGITYMTKISSLNDKIENQQAMIENQEAAVEQYETDIVNYEQNSQVKEEILSAYHFIVNDDVESAIKTLESIENKDEETEKLLLSQYKQSGTVESLTKALAMSTEENESDIIRRLAVLGNEEANKIVLDYESNNPQILAEQAYLGENHETVLQIADERKDNQRIVYLATRSLLKLKRPDDALKLAQQLDNKALQKESLQLKKKQINDDDKLEDDEKKKQLEAVDKSIEQLDE